MKGQVSTINNTTFICKGRTRKNIVIPFDFQVCHMLRPDPSLLEEISSQTPKETRNKVSPIKYKQILFSPAIVTQ